LSRRFDPMVYETNESALVTFAKNVFFENVVVSR